METIKKQNKIITNSSHWQFIDTIRFFFIHSINKNVLTDKKKIELLFAKNNLLFMKAANNCLPGGVDL